MADHRYEPEITTRATSLGTELSTVCQLADAAFGTYLMGTHTSY